MRISSEYFQNVSLGRLVLGGFTVILAILLPFVVVGSFYVQSGVRGFITAESIWSKSQKDAVIALARYIEFSDETAYDGFLQKILVQKSDENARRELAKDSPDFDLIDEYLIEGGSDPRDVRLMAYLFHYGRNVSLIGKSIQIWEKGDALFAEFISLAENIHLTLQSGTSATLNKREMLNQIEALNLKFTVLEEEFTRTLGEAATVLRTGLIWFNGLFFLLVFFGAAVIYFGFKKASSQLKAETKRYETLVAGLNESAIVAITDADGIIAYANDQFCQISGYSREELIGKTHRIIKSDFHPRKFFGELWKTISNGKVWKGEVCNRRKDGTLYWVNSTVVPKKDENGDVQYMAIRFDISKQKEAQSRLLENEKMSTLGQMASGIAHEINSPLFVVDSKINKIFRVIESGNIDPGSCINDLEKVRNNVNRISKIVKGLKLFSRNAENDPFCISKVGEIITDSLELCKERYKVHSIDLRVEIDPDVEIECRPTQLSQVILNLLSNSYDAISQNSEKWIEIRVKDAGETVKISILDSGSGIPEEVANQVMQPFFTTKEFGAGTGLGLSISKGINDSHGGSFYLDSNTTKNTCFVIEVPKRQAENRKTLA